MLSGIVADRLFDVDAETVFSLLAAAHLEKRLRVGSRIGIEEVKCIPEAS
jgi:hypothetical protein